MYCSLDRAPAAYAIDSLSIKWDNMWGYAYPPISLIPQVLQKIRLKAVRSENLVGSSLMAPQALVPRAARPFGGHPSALPTQTEAVAAEPKCNVLPDVLPDVAEASVASFQEQLVKKGVPQGARQLALAAWRPGTFRVYTAQYRVFCSWCRGISKSPTETSIEDVGLLRFRQFLFDKGLLYRTLGVYRSMLSDILPLIDDVKVGELGQVVCFLKGVFLSRPQRKTLVPEWDLPLVLMVLEAALLEPMELASLKLVTFKYLPVGVDHSKKGG